MSLWYARRRPWAEQLHDKLYRDNLSCEENSACDYHTILDRRWTMMVPNHYEMQRPDSIARSHYLHLKWSEEYYDSEYRFNVHDLDV